MRKGHISWSRCGDQMYSYLKLSGTQGMLCILLSLVVYCLPCFPNCEHLKGMNQALFIFVLLARHIAPGPGRCYLHAPCLQSGLTSIIFFIPPALRALFQPEKEKSASIHAWSSLSCWPRKPKTRGMGNLSAVGSWHSSTGTSGTICPWQGGI